MSSNLLPFVCYVVDCVLFSFDSYFYGDCSFYLCSFDCWVKFPDLCNGIWCLIYELVH